MPSHAMPSEFEKPSTRPARVSRRRGRVPAAAIALATALLFGSAACSTAAPADLAPPEQAEDSLTDGSWEVRTDLAVVSLRQAVGGEQDLDVDLYRVPFDLEWDAVTAHYAEELGDGWSRDDSIPEEDLNALRAVWTEDGPLDNATVAIALITDPVPDLDHEFQVLAVATSE